MAVFLNVQQDDLLKLKKLGFKPASPKTIHEVIRQEATGVTAILYKSSKLFLQGKQADEFADKIARLGIGERVVPEHFRKERGWIIGSDEALKGDTFGGLVVAAVKADDKMREKLQEIGVADSKKLSDQEVHVLADQIKKIAPCEIKSILPEEYNQSHSQTLLLNNLHHAVAQYLLPGMHIVDKYPGCTVGDRQEKKAESKYVEVAAASILARSVALQQLSYLSQQAGFTLPKGSTHVKEALEQLRQHKLEFRKFVKINFRNVTEFLD